MHPLHPPPRSAPAKGDPLGVKGLKYRLKILTFLPRITEPLILVMEVTVISEIIFTSAEHSKFNLTMSYCICNRSFAQSVVFWLISDVLRKVLDCRALSI